MVSKKRGKLSLTMNIKMTPEKKCAFIVALSDTGSVKLACKAAGISRQTAYLWQDDDEEFARAWKQAKRYSFDVIDDEVRDRAMNGQEQQVRYKGEVVGTVRKYDNKLLLAYWRANRPQEEEPFEPLKPKRSKPPITLEIISGVPPKEAGTEQAEEEDFSDVIG